MSRVRVPSIAHFSFLERIQVSLFQALLLGIVQGLTEFFPVSSSAHLQMAKSLLGLIEKDSLLYFDLLCHAGTLLALLFYLRKEVWEVLRSPRKIALYSLAIFPLVPAYFLLKPLRLAASNPQYLGYFLWVTAAFLFLASRKESTSSQNKQTPWQALGIGCVQTLALIPGISRSGSTIAAARLWGWEWKEAALFSFLLSIPTVLGGELLETIRLFKGQTQIFSITPVSCYAVGFLTSFGVGLIGVRWMFRVYEEGWVRPFAWYCFGAGLFAWFLFRF